jgi:hypothetical protein
VGIGKTTAFGGELVDVRRLNMGSTVAPQIAIAEVVGKNQNDIRHFP